MIVKTRVTICHPRKRRESKLGGLSICPSIYPVELHYQATYCGGRERRERDQCAARLGLLDGLEGGRERRQGIKRREGRMRMGDWSGVKEEGSRRATLQSCSSAREW